MNTLRTLLLAGILMALLPGCRADTASCPPAAPRPQNYANAPAPGAPIQYPLENDRINRPLNGTAGSNTVYSGRKYDGGEALSSQGALLVNEIARPAEAQAPTVQPAVYAAGLALVALVGHCLALCRIHLRMGEAEGPKNPLGNQVFPLRVAAIYKAFLHRREGRTDRLYAGYVISAVLAYLGMVASLFLLFIE